MTGQLLYSDVFFQKKIRILMPLSDASGFMDNSNLDKKISNKIRTKSRSR